jgi:hypothetical protein
MGTVPSPLLAIYPLRLTMPYLYMPHAMASLPTIDNCERSDSALLFIVLSLKSYTYVKLRTYRRSLSLLALYTASELLSYFPGTVDTRESVDHLVRREGHG